jgi:hypothetical protein
MQLLTAMKAHAATVSLASNMDGDSYIYESQFTGSFARINLGDGLPGDADGVYDPNGPGGVLNPNPTPFGSPIDMFPREANFLVGEITHAAIVPGFTGTVAIDSYDLGEFWTSDPNRVGDPAGSGGPPTVVSDISDQAIGLWFFNTPGSILFGALDSSDTVTYTNGLLTSIDMEITTQFTGTDPFTSAPIAWGDTPGTGTFSISGNQLAWTILDTEPSLFGPSTFDANLTGTVTSVVPIPGAVWLLGSGLLGLAGFARRRKKG